jgi:beta-galactosidase
MKTIRITFLLPCLLLFVSNLSAQQVIQLKNNWKFAKGAQQEASQIGFNDQSWEHVIVPHDWAIKGPFDKEVDKQLVAITQNGEEVATEKTGRTGALPHIGQAWYRNHFEIPNYQSGQRVFLLFEGAMSEPKVYVNGEKVGEWNYGYSYFYFDITDAIKPDGQNLLAVHLRNVEKSSRWYPGAGLFRKVQLIIKNPEHIKIWGTFLTTPKVNENTALVKIKTLTVGEKLKATYTIIDPSGHTVTSFHNSISFDGEFEQNIQVPYPQLWSPEHPHLYTAITELYHGAELVDREETRFGIRTIDYQRDTGFSLNGESRKFKGVCLHHDLGPLGAAVNKAALRRQLIILKDMGCDAIRSAHNMPSMEQLDLCDELGFMFLAESFDEWAKPKVDNGYHRFFETDAEKDVVNLVHATRNHPCIVMWSSGNEVPDQFGSIGVKRAKWLQDIFHREDPTRPVTIGMDQVKAVMESGFGAITDIPGLNYRVHLYEEAYEKFPQGFLLGSETASTVSSRGIYKFPVAIAAMKKYDDLQCSSYDLEYCSWSNLPDDDFVMQDDKPWVIGEFVWTGFDYLGEPTPYDMFWPSRSSYFGICDLAGLPKDRYYLYRSRWNTEEETLHILPHWNWKGREGEVTPVFVYTSYASAELFVNGKSMGVQKKHAETPQNRYRLMWMDVKYEPGSLKVVAFDEKGNQVAEKEVHTAGKPHQIVLESDRSSIQGNGEDLAFVTVSVVDKKGNPCPTATNKLKFEVSGTGNFSAVCNGDATSLEMFHVPEMELFSGKLVVLVEAGYKEGEIMLQVDGKGLRSGKVVVNARK